MINRFIYEILLIKYFIWQREFNSIVSAVPKMINAYIVSQTLQMQLLELCVF